MPNQRGYQGIMYEFIRYQLDGQSRTIELSTISTFEGPTSHTQECLA
jgi:hypothetical protein